MKRRFRWPVRVKRGNSTVTIYKADRKKNGHLYREFKLAYYNEIGKRTLQSFNSFKKARKAADNVNVSLMKGEVKSLVLSNDGKVVYLRALKALKSTGTARRRLQGAHPGCRASSFLAGRQNTCIGQQRQHS